MQSLPKQFAAGQSLCEKCSKQSQNSSLHAIGLFFRCSIAVATWTLKKGTFICIGLRAQLLQKLCSVGGGCGSSTFVLQTHGYTNLNTFSAGKKKLLALNFKTLNIRSMIPCRI